MFTDESRLVVFERLVAVSDDLNFMHKPFPEEVSDSLNKSKYIYFIKFMAEDCFVFASFTAAHWTQVVCVCDVHVCNLNCQLEYILCVTTDYYSH